MLGAKLKSVDDTAARQVKGVKDVITLGGFKPPTHNFFQLGGNSLVVSQLILEMERTLGCRIPARTVFRQATIAGIADAITALSPQEPPASTPSAE